MRALLDEPVDKVNKWRNERLCTAFREHRCGLTDDTPSPPECTVSVVALECLVSALST
jgi:hypothetical protein